MQILFYIAILILLLKTFGGVARTCPKSGSTVCFCSEGTTIISVILLLVYHFSCNDFRMFGIV